MGKGKNAVEWTPNVTSCDQWKKKGGNGGRPMKSMEVKLVRMIFHLISSGVSGEVGDHLVTKVKGEE